ncbi:tetratricopeptide repeat protein [Sneathiella chinensis]|uniref:Tetratricopeptide repeat protein n=1 Tax=Sneathiella chinensis TaxID=349750 RepID=A0ABQ5U9T3_9PROT|nr:tetratricopeptide repeat protein [Sneathiella chinensis]GLQ07930.1 hypothetical protein GCM10007924_31520 [Sneathiella chinensis]
MGGLLFFLSACDSPEEKARSHYLNGLQLFEEANFVKAGLEFRNALQLDSGLADAWYHLALVEEKAGNVREYAGDLQKTIELDPNHLLARLRMGRLHLYSGRLDKASSEAELILRLAPERADVWAFKAGVALKKQEIDTALDAAGKSLAIDPANVDATMVVAIRKIADGAPEEAIAIVDKVLETVKVNVPLQLTKMQAYEEMGDTEGIERMFRELIAAHPKDLRYRNKLAKFYLKQGNHQKAEAELRQIIAENPDDAGARLTLVNFLRNTAGMDAAMTELQAISKAYPMVQLYRFAMVEAFLVQAREDEALQVLQTVIDQEPQSRDGLKARVKSAEIRLKRGDRDAALKEIENVLAADAGNTEAIVLKSSIQLEEGDVETAIINLRTALRSQPDHPMATMLLARAHELNGALELAEERFDAAFKSSLADPRVAYNFTQFLLRQNQLDRAETILTRSLRVYPTNAVLLTNLAQIRLMKQDWKGAEQVAERLKALSANNIISDQIMAKTYAGRNELEMSLKAYEDAYAKAPSGINSMVSIVKLKVRNGQSEDALAFLEGIRERDPDNFHARLLYGQLVAGSGRTEDGVIEVEKVIADLPREPAGYFALFSLYAKVGDMPQAEKALDRGLEAVPDNFALNFAQANLYESRQEYDRAIAVYDRMAEKQPGSDIVMNNLASLISAHHDDEKSLRKAYGYAKRFKNSPVPHFKDTLGWIHYKLGEVELAKPLLEEAVRKMPGMPQLRYHLGMVYLAVGARKQAGEQLEEALRLAETSEFRERKEAERVLAELREPQ